MTTFPELLFFICFVNNFFILLFLSECDCDIVGSMNLTCNKHGGQCFCKDGVMGRQCDQCMPGYFNLTNSGCQSMIQI